MNKLFVILFSISLPILLSSAQEAYAAFLVIDDSVDGQITLSHDPNWEGGVNSNGTPFGPFLPGVTISPTAEFATFSGTWIAPFGNLLAGGGTIYFTDLCNPNLVSDIVTASWTSGDFPTINMDVISSPDGADLGPVPAGFTGIPEPAGVSVFINGLFEDINGVPTPIPSNLEILFASDEEICVVGGEIIPIESTTLLLAGIQTSTVWIIPIVIAGVGLLVFKIRRS